MCRFVFYLGPQITLGSLLTEPDHSLIHQSFQAREREEPLNGDGFGVAWYKPEIRPEPVLFKEVNPAWNSINLISLAPVASSHCVLAHVRAASPGLAVTQLNCHPFARGRLAFMHNGEVGGFFQTRRHLLAQLSDRQFSRIESTGDSEIVFALAMDHLEAGDGPLTVERMASALGHAIETVERAAAEAGSDEVAYLNMVLTDGQQAVVSRYVTPGADAAQSLYLHQGSRYRCEDGVCMMIDEAESDARTLIVSSEPLSSDEGWTPVPVNGLLKIHSNRQVEHQALAPVRQLN